MGRSSRSASTRRSARKRTSKGTKVKKSVTLFECLSNEILFDVFEYLDGCEIFHSFSKLNTRFENLLNNLPINLHFNLRLTSEENLVEYCRNTLSPCRHRIVSLRLPMLSEVNRFFNSNEMGVSFPRLESIVLLGILYQTWPILGQELLSFPRLYSLSVRFVHVYDGAYTTDIYGLIVCLPALKYCHVSSDASTPPVLHPMTSKTQMSPIEQLKIDHKCTIRLLFNIMSYLPYLSRVTCQHLTNCESSRLFDKKLMFHSQLKSFIVQKCDVSFDQFELLLYQISLHLQLLKINASISYSHFLADRWESVISNSMPELKQFTLIGSLFNRHRNAFYSLHDIIRQFTSPFWLERGWHLSFETTTQSNKSKAFFIVQPVQTSWFHLPNENEKASSMIVECRCDSAANSSWISVFFNNFGHLCTALDVTCTFKQLIQIIENFPHVKSLKYHFASNYYEPLHRLTKTSNINKLVLCKLSHLKAVQNFFEFCPLLDFLQIDQPQKLTCEHIIYDILFQKTSRTFRPKHLCISSADINQQMVNSLKKSVYGSELETSYIVECVREKTLSILHR